MDDPQLLAGELHVFHLHQTAFLVKKVNGVQTGLSAACAT